MLSMIQIWRQCLQLAVNTQIHPATFGGIANDDYIREFIYAQGQFFPGSLSPYLFGNARILPYSFIFATCQGRMGF
jgi:hypothetical protein